jgi:maleate cis-trans isomerase
MEETFRVGLLVPSSNTIMEVDLYRSLSAPIPKNWAKEGKEGK